MNDLNGSEKDSIVSLSFPECIGILKDILRQWWVILLIALSAAMITDVAVSKMYQPMYQTSSTFVVTTKEPNSSIITDLKSASETAQQFSQILNSNVLKKKVAQEIGMPQFDAQMEVELIPETNLMELTVTADSAMDAFNIITAVMNNYNTVSDYVIDNVFLQVLRPAEIPQSPVNRLDSRRSVRIGFLAAMLVMIGLFAILSYMKDTVKSEQDVSEKVDASLMGTIYHEKKRKSLNFLKRSRKVSMIIQNPMLSFRYMEANKLTASRIRSRMERKKIKILAVTSVTENEGKSTVAANLALALAQEKKKVLLIDCDFRKPAQYKIFDRDVKKIADLNAVLTGKADTANLIQNIEGTGLLCIFNLTANMHMFENGEQKVLSVLLKQLRNKLDYIIIDTSPIGLVSEMEEVSMLADASLLVIRHDFVMTRDINDAVDALNQTNGQVLGCVLNDVPGYYSMDGAYGYGYGYGYGGRYGK